MVEKAVLLSFRINDNQVIEGAESRFFDKVPMKFANYDEAFQKKKASASCHQRQCVRARFIARNTVLMPSCVSIGAYVDEGTWLIPGRPSGSCAQIGKTSTFQKWRGYRRRAGAAAN